MQGIGLFVVYVLIFFLAAIPANIAGKKGYSVVGFYFFGLFFFIIALIVALCLGDKKQFRNQQITNVNNISPADEIKKYKELLDQGAITEEEFQEKKRQLLNL